MLPLNQDPCQMKYRTQTSGTDYRLDTFVLSGENWLCTNFLRCFWFRIPLFFLFLSLFAWRSNFCRPFLFFLFSPKGKFTNSTGQYSCNNCTRGEYTNITGSTNCTYVGFCLRESITFYFADCISLFWSNRFSFSTIVDWRLWESTFQRPVWLSLWAACRIHCLARGEKSTTTIY